jgi:caffeoyl-CoA O-methyltransferase
MILAPLIENYTTKYAAPLAPYINDVLTYTLAQHGASHMVSGHEQGLLLQFLSTMQQPKRILEIGTFTGFSALCLAQGLAKNGLLYTIELRMQDAAIAQGFINKSPYKTNIKVLTGDANDIIPTLNEQWDLVFIDADKTGYIAYYEMALANLAPNGIIIADNVLFHGEVIKEPVIGKSAKAIHAFNEYVKADKRVSQVLLTVRDGLMLIKKL